VYQQISIVVCWLYKYRVGQKSDSVIILVLLLTLNMRSKVMVVLYFIFYNQRVLIRLLLLL